MVLGGVGWCWMVLGVMGVMHMYVAFLVRL